MRKHIDFIDVKKLYDEAYAEKEKARVNLKRFRKLIGKAQKLDKAYRAQLVKEATLKFGRAA